MIYDLSNTSDLRDFNIKSEYYVQNKKKVDLTQKKDTRTSIQNRALHLYFNFISEELNNLGLEFHYQGLNIIEITTPYTPEIVKNFFWRPIQIALFDIESTTKINTHQINQIIDVITKFFGDKGVMVEFPSIETLNKN